MTTLSKPLFDWLSQFASALPGMVTHLVRRPSLLSITAGMAGVSAIANAVAVAAPVIEQAPATRLGTSIQQSVRERDQALVQQKRALDLREQAQRAAEARLKADLQARQADSAAPGVSGGEGLPDQNEPYDELARIYQTMKPAKAAVIFERLDLDVQTQVARRMRERSIALILSSMSPNGAVQLSMALAGKKVVKAPPVAPKRTEAAGAKRGSSPAKPAR